MKGKVQNSAPVGAAKKATSVVTNVASLDATTPIPLEHYSPKAFLLNSNRKYIPFLEPKDNFAQLLLEAKLLSPTNNACVNSKTEYCIGSGWYLKDTEQEDKELTEWAVCVNRKSQTLNDVIKSIFDNLWTVGNAWIEVVKGKIGDKPFVKIYLNSFLDMRLAMPDDDDIPVQAYKSKHFRRQGIWSLKEEDAAKLPLYTSNPLDKSWVKGDDDFERTIIHLKNSVSGYDYYGMPSNVSCLPQQILEYKVARFNMDNFDNNLVIGGMILLQGSLTPEEAQKLGNNIIAQHSGDGKRGRYVILAGEAGIENTKLVPFERQKDGDFIEFDKRIEQKIISANNWDALLAGIQQGGALGNGGSGHLRSVFDIKYKTVIEPMQTYVIEKFLMPLLQICDAHMGTKFSKHKLGLKTVVPVSFLGDIDVNSILTKNEGRKALGYSEKEGAGEDWIKSSSAQKTPAGDVQN
jgi:hypothetical protein